MRVLAEALLVPFLSLLQADPLGLPPRPANAPGGAEFARSVEALSQDDRERKVFEAVTAGNIPPFLRKTVPVTVRSGANVLVYDVLPDYLAIGSDEDHFLTPLSPSAAQAVADRLDCTLPTPLMVDQIYQAATVKLTPKPIPPTPAMTTVPVFVRHNATVREQMADKPPGALVAGHKKDVVIANRAFAKAGKVAIYGWHKDDGTPIQPLYTGHKASWVDYSHGVRLVRRRMTVNGKTTTIDRVLADPALAPIISRDGVMRQTRYPAADFHDDITETLNLDDGVRVVIDRPKSLPPSKPVLLIFYGVPNGNTIEQTVGKAARPGLDWHFDIQHVGAQTRFLRDAARDRSVVVAYFENDRKGWPAWREAHGDDAVPGMIDAVASRFPGPETRIVLSGHSGGGSLIFGYLNRVTAIPDRVERVAFLDANYAYDTTLHRDKLVAWLKASDAHFLSVIAYDDASALLDGKPFVSADGGTWGRSHRMLDDLKTAFPFRVDRRGDLERASALAGRVTFLLMANPEHKVLHTVQVERNGVIEGVLSGTGLQGVGYVYFGDRAYTRFVRAE